MVELMLRPQAVPESLRENLPEAQPQPAQGPGTALPPEHLPDPATSADVDRLLEGLGKAPRRHIAMFIYAPTGGGAQRRSITLANAFAERGHRVDFVVVRSRGLSHSELSPRVRLFGFDRNWGPIEARVRRTLRHRGVETALSVPALARYLRRERPDLLLSSASHVNLVSLLAWKLARRPMPLVLRVSNHPSANLNLYSPMQKIIRRYLRWLARRIYPWADAVIAVSDGVADDLARITHMPRERIRTIYNPIVTPEFLARAEESLDHPWFAPGAPPVILGVGGFKIQKDFRTLLRAFKRVRAVQPVRLVILGKGPQRQFLKSIAKQQGFADDVYMPGYCANPMAWMSKASVFALSSLWEGLPGVLIESMACGCPVVSTDCPSGPREILADGVYGHLVPPGDPDALAQAILKTLSFPPDRRFLKRRASEFFLDNAVDHYLDVFEECIA